MYTYTCARIQCCRRRCISYMRAHIMTGMCFACNMRRVCGYTQHSNRGNFCRDQFISRARTVAARVQCDVCVTTTVATVHTYRLCMESYVYIRVHEFIMPIFCMFITRVCTRGVHRRRRRCRDCLCECVCVLAAAAEHRALTHLHLNT